LAHGDDEEAAEAAPTAPSKAKRQKEEAAPVSDVVGYKFPRGLFTQSDLGIFWRYLGFSDSLSGRGCTRCKYPSYYVSNAAPFIGFSVGYDILPTVLELTGAKVPSLANRFGITAQLSFASGYVDGAAPYSRARSHRYGTTFKDEESPKDHAIFMLHPALVANVIPPPFERLLLEARIFLGGSMFSPSAQRFGVVGDRAQAERIATDPNWWFATLGANAGFGLSIKYMTLLTNFVIGSDLALYNMFSPGWGTELYLPPWGNRICRENDVPPFAIGFANDSGTCPNDSTSSKKPVAMLPLVWATSFSPIIIKYVF
jgi:hypothetical protein